MGKQGVTQDTDSTLEPDANLDNHADYIPNNSIYLATPSATGKKVKRGRPKKLKSPHKQSQNVEDDPSQPDEQNLDMEFLHTRSKAGRHNYITHTSQ